MLSKKGEKRATRAKAYSFEEDAIFTSPRLLEKEESKTEVQPKKFFGEPGEGVEKWLKSFDRLAKGNNWPENRQCDILPAYLNDRAAECLGEIPQQDKINFENLKKLLSSILCQKKHNASTTTISNLDNKVNMNQPVILARNTTVS